MTHLKLISRTRIRGPTFVADTNVHLAMAESLPDVVRCSSDAAYARSVPPCFE